MDDTVIYTVEVFEIGGSGVLAAQIKDSNGTVLGVGYGEFPMDAMSNAAIKANNIEYERRRVKASMN